MVRAARVGWRVYFFLVYVCLFVCLKFSPTLPIIFPPAASLCCGGGQVASGIHFRRMPCLIMIFHREKADDDDDR